MNGQRPMGAPGWIHLENETFRLLVRLTPKAARDQIDGEQLLPDGREALAARVRAVPENGKANKALKKLIAKAARVAPSDIEIVSGITSRLKTLRIDGEPAALVASVIARPGVDTNAE